MTLGYGHSNLGLYLKIIVLVPLCIMIVMAPYSLLLGWNVITSILFFCFIVPALNLYLHFRFFRSSRMSWRAMASMVSFYAIMVFLSYKHFPTDFFAFIMLSFVFNVFVIVIVMLVERDERRA